MHARKDRGKFGWRLAVIAVLAFASVAMTAYHGYRLYRLLFLNESAARAELCESLTALENARIDEAKRHLLEGKTFIADSRWKEGNAHATLVELEIARRMQRLDVNSPLLDSAETAVLSSRVAPLITWFRLLRAETQGRAGLGQRVLETLDEISATDALPGQKSWIALEHARTYRRLGQSREAIAEYEAALATATAESDTWRSAVVAGARIPTRSLISIVTSRNSLTRSANSLRSGGTESRLHTGT
jgi:tetratricopeptide (TPR) repeat protein